MARYSGRIIVGVGGKQQQADWNESDSNSPSFIKNKPDLSGALTRQVVNELPTEDIDPNCIYMIPKSDPDTGDYYDEYMYISNNWEQIGSTQMTQVQSDWAESDPTAVDYIANKPNNLDLVVPFTVNGSTVSTTVSVNDILSAITAGQGVYATLDGLYLPLSVYQSSTPEKVIFSGMIEGIETVITGKEVSGVWTWALTENDLNASSDWFGTQQEFDALGTYDENINYHIEQELATVAFTGDYDDLSNKPAVAQADWSQSDTTAPDYIKYKPPLPQTSTLETSATPVLDVEDSVIITCTTPVTSLTINRVGGGQYESNVYFTTGNTPFTMTVPNTLSGIVGSTSLQANTDYIVCIKDNRMVISYNGYTGGVTVNDNAPTLAYGQTSTVGTVDGTSLTVTMPAAPSVPSNLVTGVNVSGVDTTLTLRVITQSDYDALVQGGTVDANTVYMIS